MFSDELYQVDAEQHEDENDILMSRRWYMMNEEKPEHICAYSSSVNELLYSTKN